MDWLFTVWTSVLFFLFQWHVKTEFHLVKHWNKAPFHLVLHAFLMYPANVHPQILKQNWIFTSFEVKGMWSNAFLLKITMPSHEAIKACSYEVFLALNSFSVSKFWWKVKFKMFIKVLKCSHLRKKPQYKKTNNNQKAPALNRLFQIWVR